MTPNKEKVKGTTGATLSPMKAAELRSTYIKQLGELKIIENGILTNEEYEEQREDLVQLMRQLNK